VIGVKVDSLYKPVSKTPIHYQAVIAWYSRHYSTAERYRDSGSSASECWLHTLVRRGERSFRVGRIPKEIFLVEHYLKILTLFLKYE
jgi:hypothetical protein